MHTSSPLFLTLLLSLMPMTGVPDAFTSDAGAPTVSRREARGPKPVAIVIPQQNSPIEIVSYEAAYSEGGRYSRRGIQHSIRVRNRGAQKVVAYRVVLVSFDVFNRFLDRTGGISMDDLDVGATTDASWIATAYADFAFHTGVAYVKDVRLEDGTIWRADETPVLAELRKIERDFDAKNLEERPVPAAAGAAGTP